MCFMLYAATQRPIALVAWSIEARAVNVTAVSDEERRPLLSNFTLPHIQCIGSSTGCGCDFPNEDADAYPEREWIESEKDTEQRADEQRNREELADLLRSTGEPVIELFGAWTGGFEEPPIVRESISIEELSKPTFCFLHGAFYTVSAGAV
jgi:hypothetical protein